MPNRSLVRPTKDEDHPPFPKVTSVLHGDLQTRKPVPLWMMLKLQLKALNLNEIERVESESRES
jgi:hypothetical protein